MILSNHHFVAFALLGVVLASVVWASPHVANAAVTNGAFAGAIKTAQARTVKIYGAGIGRVAGYGTGVIVSGEGEILTAAGAYLATPNLRVGLPDGSIHLAKVIRRDQNLQLALLSIEAKTPQFFTVDKKTQPLPGDWVLAIANAFKVADGAEPMGVTLGVVSSRTRLDARRGTHDVDYADDVLLIDAITSNPGAAGGAVVTAEGDLVGLVGKVAVSNQTGTRLNYAIPTDLLANFVAGKSSPETVTEPKPKGSLGFRLFQLGGRNGPAFIDRVVKGGPADRAGLRADDLVVAIDGSPIKNVREFTEKADSLVAGKEVLLIVKRNNQLIQTPITPTEAKPK